MMPLHNDWLLPARQQIARSRRVAHLWGRALTALLALLLIGGQLVGCTASRSSAPTNDLQLTLVHSNDTMGKLEPCG